MPHRNLVPLRSAVGARKIDGGAVDKRIVVKKMGK
jgi:hypothetical protein